ncbi:restriction endonuclease subunit S [Planktothrix paucivesiculata]|uniref:Type I restriction enzyme specificity subunit n=1 Tax=Planktothrix paucivesiculata PCC 9631 TaxID=671071 RepID=A0A7Z9BHX5_9CYAN|nr:restriction endonuclease subunit S [Planktothrix paucivesiculata]VXD14238.1 putative Type I restriction enzyme specificity subunit [Planktothrix paucivesiculata PCC 9631]
MQLTIDSKQLPMGWEVKKLGEVCNISTGKLNANAAVENGKYPFFTCSREIFTIDHFAFDCEAILLAGNNAVGDFNVKHYKGKFNAYQRTYVITINQEETLLYKYLYLQVESALKDFKLKSVGAGTKFLKLDMIKNLKLYLPPLPEQKQIVAILDEAFEGINRAIANTEKNLANSRQVFESYLNAIFTQKGDEWEEVELGSLSERITKGSSPKWQGINYVDEPGILFVTSENVGENQMLFEKTKYVEENFNEKDSKSILSFGDVLTNIVGASIGRTAIYDREDLANINQAVCLIRCKSDKLINKYLSYLLNSPYFRQILHENEINNARANLSLGFFRGLQIPLPSLAEQQSIVFKMDDLSSETQRLEAIYRQKIATLNELKQSILQKAFAGELTVRLSSPTTADTSKTVKEEIVA